MSAPSYGGPKKDPTANFDTLYDERCSRATTCEDYSPEITDIHLHFSKVAVSFGPSAAAAAAADGCNMLLARIPIL